MLKRYETIGYGLAFVALCSFLLGWKMLVAPQRPEEIAELQKRLNITAENVSTPVVSENADDFLKIYAVNVAHTPPFKSRFIGYGIYLGQGIVLTAAHVVGHWPGYAQPHVLIAGLDLPASVLKQGSPEHTDLALLSVDQERLPISLQLRRNPLCKEPLQVSASNSIAVSVEVSHPDKRASGFGIGCFQRRKKMPYRHHECPGKTISLSRRSWTNDSQG
jgi:hypothetical protein